jgi:hypothetical protein
VLKAFLTWMFHKILLEFKDKKPWDKKLNIIFHFTVSLQNASKLAYYPKYY